MNSNDSEQPKSDLPLSDTTFTLASDPTFSFDLPEPVTPPPSSEETEQLFEPAEHIHCICPKCTGLIEVKLADIPDNGLTTSCPSCNATVQIVRESVARRAKRQSRQIHCQNCGGQLDQQPHCPSCGLLFPDYYVAVDPSEVRRQARNEYFAQKLAVLKSFNLSLGPVLGGGGRAVPAGYSPKRESRQAASKTFTFSKPRNLTTVAISAVIAIILVTGGAFAYKTYRANKEYTNTLFITLHAMRFGTDANLKSCRATKAEWESATNSGLRYTPGNSIRNEESANRIHGNIDKYIQLLNNPPKKFIPTNEKLLQIRKIYLDSENLATSKPASLQDLNSSIDDIDKRMNQTSKALVAVLPEGAKKDLSTAKLKYRGLKDL